MSNTLKVKVQDWNLNYACATLHLHASLLKDKTYFFNL